MIPQNIGGVEVMRGNNWFMAINGCPLHLNSLYSLFVDNRAFGLGI